jgi:hypothetical protein
MRAAFVLALLLSLVTPPGVWQTAPDSSAGKGAATAAMGSPAGAVCQLVRDFAKADKTFSSSWLPALDRASSFPLVVDFDHPIAHASLLHAIAIDCPPLSPRPPPVA